MKVSIITVSYNSYNTIGETFKSVKNQDYKEIEYIVIDGNSSDGTKQTILNNSDIIDNYVIENDNGIYDAMNKGLKIATGDIVGFLNADDFFAGPSSISHIVKEFQNSDAKAVYGGVKYVKKNSISESVRVWEPEPFNKLLFRKGWMPPHPATYIKREVFDELGGFKTHYPISADYELMVRYMYQKEIRVSHISEIVVIMRTGGASNKNFIARIRTAREIFNIWKEYDPLIAPLIVVKKPLRKLSQFF